MLHQSMPIFNLLAYISEVPDLEDSSVFDDNMVIILLEEFAQFGDTILVRFVADTMWITFREGQSVLEALKKTNGSIRVSFVLTFRNWDIIIDVWFRFKIIILPYYWKLQTGSKKRKMRLDYVPVIQFLCTQLQTNRIIIVSIYLEILHNIIFNLIYLKV